MDILRTFYLIMAFFYKTGRAKCMLRNKAANGNICLIDAMIYITAFCLNHQDRRCHLCEQIMCYNTTMSREKLLVNGFFMKTEVR